MRCEGGTRREVVEFVWCRWRSLGMAESARGGGGNEGRGMEGVRGRGRSSSGKTGTGERFGCGERLGQLLGVLTPEVSPRNSGGRELQPPSAPPTPLRALRGGTGLGKLRAKRSNSSTSRCRSSASALASPLLQPWIPRPNAKAGEGSSIRNDDEERSIGWRRGEPLPCRSSRRPPT